MVIINGNLLTYTFYREFSPIQSPANSSPEMPEIDLDEIKKRKIYWILGNQ